MKTTILLVLFITLTSCSPFEKICNTDVDTHCKDAPKDSKLECLVQQVDELTTKCTDYVKGVEECWSSLNCDNFWCLLNNAHNLTTKCLNTTFFNELVEANGGITNSTQNPCFDDAISHCGGLKHPREVFTCLRDTLQQDASPCLNYINGFDGCFRDIDSVCPMEQQTATTALECLWHNKDKLTDDCHLTKYFEWVNDNIITSGFEKLGVIGDELEQCLTDSDVRSCGSYNVTDIRSCLNDKWETVQQSSCADRLEAAIKKELPNIPVCVKDVAAYCEGRNDTFECLKQQLENGLENMSEECTEYIAPISKCLNDTSHHCEGESFLCLVNRTARFTKECLDTQFFSDVMEWAGGSSTWLQHPCAPDLDFHSICKHQDPRDAIRCLLQQPIVISKACTDFINTKDTCLGPLFEQCHSKNANFENMTACLWENRDQLAEACLHTDWFERLTSDVNEKFKKMIPACVDTENLKLRDCLSWDFEQMKDCFEDESQHVTDSCNKEIDEWSKCRVSSTSAICKDKNLLEMIPCLWENKDLIFNDDVKLDFDNCFNTDLFKDISKEIRQIFPKSALLGCTLDIVELKCKADSFDSAVDCLIDNKQQLSSTCQPFINDVDLCTSTLDSLDGKCDDTKSRVECIWNNREAIGEKCLGSRLFNLIEEARETTLGGLIECAVDLVQLDCVNSSLIPTTNVNRLADELPQYDFETALNCLLKNNNVLTGSCHRYLGGLDKCWDELQNFCEHPTSQASYALTNTESAVQSCIEGFSTIDRTSLLQAGFKCLKCLGDSRGLIPCLKSTSGCDQLVKGVDECTKNIQQDSCEGPTTFAQLATGVSTIDACQTSPFFQHAQAGISKVMDLFGHSELFTCHEDVLKFGCLDSQQNRGAKKVFDCLKDSVNRGKQFVDNPLKQVSEHCSGAIVDIADCMEELQGTCSHTDNYPRCIYNNRNRLSEKCTATEAFNKLSKFFKLPLPDRDVVFDLTPNFEWPCSLDVRLYGCDTKEDDDILSCLKENRGMLSLNCHEFLLGRELCLNDIADLACDAVNQVGDWLKLTTQHDQLCVWTNRAKVSQQCIHSVFFDFFLYPRASGGNDTMIFTNGSTNGNDSNNNNPDSPSSTPTYAITSECRTEEALYCSHVKCEQSDCKAMRDCLKLNELILSSVCRKWAAGRDICYNDAQLLCKRKPELACLMENSQYFSAACRGSVFYQSAVLGAATGGNNPGIPIDIGDISDSTTSTDESDDSALGAADSKSEFGSSDGTVMVIMIIMSGIIVATVVGVAVFMCICLKRRKNAADRIVVGLAAGASPTKQKSFNDLSHTPYNHTPSSPQLGTIVETTKPEAATTPASPEETV